MNQLGELHLITIHNSYFQESSQLHFKRNWGEGKITIWSASGAAAAVADDFLKLLLAVFARLIRIYEYWARPPPSLPSSLPPQVLQSSGADGGGGRDG